MCACASTTGESSAGAARRLRHGIGYSSAFSTHPGIFEKSTRGGEKISTSWFITGFGACRSVDGRRRNHGQGWRGTDLMIIGAPVAKVGRPWPSDVMGKRPLEGQRTLLEVVVVMGRETRAIPRSGLEREHVDHQGRTTPDAPETSLLRRNVQVVGPDAVTSRWLRPGLHTAEYWDAARA